MFRWLLVSVVLGCVGLGMSSPAVRAKALQLVRQNAGWTRQAQEADPAGFMEHVRVQLRADLAGIRDSIGELRSEQEQLATLQQTRQRELAASDRLLSSFREAWQAGQFPVEVLGQNYTSDQLQSQVALLLEERGGYESSLERIREASESAAERIRELTVQQQRTGTSLELVDTQKELLVSRRLQSGGDELMAGVDSLLSENRVILSADPVRPLDALMAAEDSGVGGESPSMARVMQYLQRGLPGMSTAGLSSATAAAH